jgi:hypothetical protein
VKPGDHPEFFRLPPPPGASRESSIRLDRGGTFWHDGSPVKRKQLADALHRWIAVHPDDGRFILTNGYDWTYFTVEDTPFFVTSVRHARAAAPTLVISDGSEERLDAVALAVDEEGACFARVKGGRFWARFSRRAQIELEPLLAADDPPRLVLGDREVRLERRQ